MCCPWVQIQPGLFEKLLNKKLYKEENYKQLIKDEDGVQYSAPYWNPETTAHFCFVILSKRPTPPDWAAENFFVLRVAAGD